MTEQEKDLEMEATMSHAASLTGGITDEVLVAAAREGDYQAFERLYAEHRLTVYRYVYQMLHSRDEAEDITQEAFVRAFQNLHRFRKQAKFSTWIVRIAMNLCTDRVRMNSRRASLEQQEAAGALEWMTIGKTINPTEEMERERRAEIVRKALLGMPAHHRSVLILRDFEEKDYHEIAEILGCSVGGAKLRVLRARRALRDRLIPLLGEGKEEKSQK
ncbi:MAG TPA: sigma-70 family RNA polymerase sigma factor [Fimbriimonadales bacterium]|nr:sigma-70 family RNA polymerase sigma factor [Fimbriimonadales bacterium]